MKEILLGMRLDPEKIERWFQENRPVVQIAAIFEDEGARTVMMLWTINQGPHTKDEKVAMWTAMEEYRRSKLN